MSRSRYYVDDANLSGDDVIVALMGPTGSGKSSFIERATGMAGIAGHSLKSCTSEVSVFRLPHPRLNLCFVDTPGFDDTTKSDLDILKLISKWLSKTYQNQLRLAGLLYFHRISDNRMAGTSLKNFHLFEQLCGEDFKNIVLTTTMWDEVDEHVGAAREQELARDYWRPMLERGSSIKRFLYTRESAFDILTPIFDEVKARSTLLIRKEMNDSSLLLKETSAGKMLKMELEELVARHQDVLGRIQRELRDPTVDGDQLDLLMEDYQTAHMQLQRATIDQQKMKGSMEVWICKLSKRVKVARREDTSSNGKELERRIGEKRMLLELRNWLEKQKKLKVQLQVVL